MGGGTALRVNGLTKSFGGMTAVREATFSINEGERVAILGPNGAGKSTIINLLPRFYDPNKGQVCIDEQNIHNVTLSSLRKNISLVEYVLFVLVVNYISRQLVIL